MSKTKRYYPECFLHNRTNYRYFSLPFLKWVKLERRSKRKTLKKMDIGDGSHYNKLATDTWHYD